MNENDRLFAGGILSVTSPLASLNAINGALRKAA